MQSPEKITDRPDSRPAGQAAITAAQTAVTDEAPSLAPLAPDAPPPTDANGYRTAPDHFNTGWPAGVPYIVGNEACERFSFYGMRAILYVHLVSLYTAAAVTDASASATATYHLFVAAVYAL